MFIPLLALGIASGAPAQICYKATASHTAQQSLIFGQITDPTGAPIPKAQVMAKSERGERIYTTADESGCYQLEVQPGRYTTRSRYPAFRPAAQTIEVAQGQATLNNMELSVASCSGLCGVMNDQSELSLCVEDRSGTPLADATVTLTALDTVKGSAPPHIALDDWGCGGLYVAVGRYRVVVTALEFHFWQATLKLKVGQTSTSDIHLKPAKKQGTS